MFLNENVWDWLGNKQQADIRRALGKLLVNTEMTGRNLL